MTATRSYRVAMVATCPFPSMRGSQVLIRELAEHLAQAGNEVHVVTYPSAEHMVPVERIAIHRVRNLPGLRVTRPRAWQKIVLDLLLLFLLLRVVRRERIDVIHAHNAEAPLIAFVVRLLSGVPVVYHAHNAVTEELPWYFRSRPVRFLAARAGEVLDRYIAARADACIALSNRLATFLSVRGAAGRVAIIPPGFAGLPNRSRDPSQQGFGPFIMYCGNLDPYQNLGCLIEGFERVCAAEPRARLVVVTQETADRRAARRRLALARRPGVTVRTVNTFAQSSREIRRADILVCPRVSWSGFPIKVLHYMASGRPIVQAQGSAHALEDAENALLFADDDPVALARAILRLARDPGLAVKLGRNAQEVVRRDHAWRRLVPSVEAVYRRVIPGDADGRIGGRGRPRTASARSVPAEIGGRLGAGPFQRSLRLLGGVLWAFALAGCAPQSPEPLAPLPPIYAAPVPPPEAISETYRLQAGDVIRVRFLFHPELDLKVPVSPDGHVAIQGIGSVFAQGKTASELANDVREAANDLLREPEVSVIVAQLGQRNVYVGGEVRLPGPVPFREGMTPLQAIMDRGGFTEVARKDSVLHLTLNEDTYDASRLDLSRNIDQGAPEVTALRVYDVVYVPRTFIGDANAFVRLYITGLLPTVPRFNYPISP
jgi:protein involved in polysaccharide export with SLBB domain/glycosyltransferase involved in cell wall biosynthesis